MVIFILLLEQSTLLSNSRNIAKQLILQKNNLVIDIDQLARHLPKVEGKKGDLATICPNYFNQFRSIYTHREYCQHRDYKPK